jgi:protein-tyrosine phosphatase
MTENYDRHLRFDSVMNFRDIGGYRGARGKTVVWRRIFRSAEFRDISRGDLDRLTQELGVVSIIDLRSEFELKKQSNGLLEACGIRYCNIALMTDDDDDPNDNAKRYDNLPNLGDFYLDLMRKREFGTQVVEALRMIADPSNHPLVFHCAVGKDRTGILTAMLLKLLGVKEDDIIEDYTLSEPYMDELLARIRANPKEGEGIPDIPDCFWKASAESMKKLLSTLKKEYISIEKYLIQMGMPSDLPKQLKNILLD